MTKRDHPQTSEPAELLPAHPGLAALTSGAAPYPFTRLRRLLEGLEPGITPAIDLTLGEPNETMPGFLVDKLREAQALYGKYPPIRGSDELRQSIAGFLARRYSLKQPIDIAHEIIPTNGSREGLFTACLPAAGRKSLPAGVRPAVLICNPYYAAYIGAALAVGAEPVYLNATVETGHLPDLEAIAGRTELLDRAIAFYLCSPANPQGSVASAAYIRRALDLARRHDFMLFLDECYSEIYGGDPPPGGLQVAEATPERFANLVVFNSLSKRSNLPGLRSGFCAGDGAFLDSLAEIRNLIAPQVPGPTQHASAAIWDEEQHAAVNRAAYRAKFDLCDRLLKGRFGYKRPAGGFFLWLDMEHLGGGRNAAVTLWKERGVKVIPGSFLASEAEDGVNPGDRFVRLALVRGLAEIEEALKRMAAP